MQLSVAEINAVLCEKCRKKLRDLVKEKITDQLVDQVMGVAVGGAPREG